MITEAQKTAQYDKAITIAWKINMNLKFTHKPNYFFFAERFIGFLQQKISKTPEQTHYNLPLEDVYHIFNEDFASTTTNLESILNLVEKYTVNQNPLLSSYFIDAKTNTLDLQLHTHALADLHAGQALIPPDSQ